MSEQKGEQTSGEPTSLGVGSDVSCSSDTQSEPVATSAQEPAHGLANAETPRLVPEQVAAREMPEADAPKADAAATHAPNPDAAEADAPRIPGKVIIMSSGDRAWADQDAGSEPDAGESQGMFGKRRIAALAAVVALAVIAGALGGALATMVLTHVAGDDTASSGNHALEVSMARIDAEVLALKASVEHTSKLGLSQFSKTSDRLDKLEKAQAEPAAKIAKLSETVDKLRAAPAAAPVPVAAGAGRGEGCHRLGFALGGSAGNTAQGRSRQVADGRRLDTARCRQWRRPDRRPAGHLRSLCRRSRAGARPDRRHPPPGRPLGGRDQQGLDRRAIKRFRAKWMPVRVKKTRPNKKFFRASP